MAASSAAKLTRKLLKIGGHDVDVVLPDFYLRAVVERGELFDATRVRTVRGAANQCHRNAASLWLTAGLKYFLSGIVPLPMR